MASLTLCGVIFVLIGFGAYLPIASHYIYKYYKLRKHVIMQKHYAEIELYIATLSLCIIFVIPFIALMICQIFPPHYQPYFMTPTLIFATYSPVLFSWRCYVNYYAIKYSNAIDSEQWKQLINPKHNVNNRQHYDSDNYFIKYKHKYGNYKYFYKHVICSFSLITIVIVTCRIIFRENERMIYTTVIGSAFIFVFVFVGLCTYLYCKTPRYGDIFFIHEEMKLLITEYAIGFLFLMVLGVAVIFVEDKQLKSIFHLLMLFVFMSLFFIGILFQTLYVINKNKLWLTTNDDDDISDALLSNPNGKEHSNIIHGRSNKSIELEKMSSLSLERNLSAQTLHSAKNNKKCKLSDVLSDENGFDSFFFHLNKEFSTEILLSLLEMTQYKEKIYLYVKNELNDANNDYIKEWDPYEYLKYPLKSKLIPKSHIVYGEIDEKYDFYVNWIKDKIKKEKTELIIRSYCLFNKYVSAHAEFEVNISGACRRKLIDLMNNISEWISYKKFDELDDIEVFSFLFHVFDDCLKQNIGLLNSSFGRYRYSILYHEWTKIWKNKDKKNKNNSSPKGNILEKVESYSL